jgi:Zn-dependent protease with chaperone function
VLAFPVQEDPVLLSELDQSDVTSLVTRCPRSSKEPLRSAPCEAKPISALEKLQQNDKPFKKMNHATAAMCIDDPLQHHEKWYHRLYDTHPPIAQRIAELEKIAVGQSV